MYLTVDKDAGPSQTVLVVRGELDLATVPILRASVDEALAAPPRRLVIDLSVLDFIDSSGCHELARAAKRCAALDVDVVAVVPPGNRSVRRIIDFMQFGDLLPVRDSVPPA